MGELKAGVGISAATDTSGAVREAVDVARSTLEGATPGLAVLTATVDHDAAAVHAALREALPDVLIHGVTTSLGVLGSEGVASGAKGAVGVLLLGGEGVRFSCGSAPVGEDAKATGRAAAEALGGDESPAMVFFNSSPGLEEDLLRGVSSVLGDVPIFGGSAADHAIAGDWSVFTNDGAVGNAISLGAIYGDIAVGGHFLAPYEAAGPEAEVTSADGRTLVAIDGKPASTTLGEWVGDAIASQVANGGNVLAQTALRPLGIRLEAEDRHYYVTIHPANIRDDGAVDVFGLADEGTRLCAMQGTREGLVSALDDLIAGAKASAESTDLKAGLLIYCAGCAGSVGQALHIGLKEKWTAAMGDVPLLGMCTFGEQGTVPGFGPLHANLSLGLVLLGGR